MSDLLKFGRSMLQQQGFSSLLGAELSAFDKGSAEFKLEVTDRLKQQHGFVHGGVISYLADNCLTYAAGSYYGDCVTSEYKINYVRPAIGHTLIARATVLHSGKRQAVCDCRISAVSEEAEVLVAVAQGTVNKVGA